MSIQSNTPGNNPKYCRISDKTAKDGKEYMKIYELIDFEPFQIASTKNIYANTHRPSGRLYLTHP